MESQTGRNLNPKSQENDRQNRVFLQMPVLDNGKNRQRINAL
jgi:hypothetical protein